MVKLERGRQLRAAEDQHLGAAREQMLTGRAERGDVVRQVAGLDAVVDDVHHRGLIGGAVRREKLHAALLKGALVDAGLHRAVGREQARALHAARLQRVARERDHVQHRNGHGLADLLIVVVCGVAGHNEEIRADALEPLRALDHLRHGVLAAVEQRRRAVGNVRV